MSLAKLTQKQIQEISKLLAEGITQSAIADKFRITQSQVSQIKTGKCYARYPKLYITGVSEKTKQILVNIAANKNMKIHEYLKYEILKLVEITPPHLKLPRDSD